MEQSRPPEFMANIVTCIGPENVQAIRAWRSLCEDHGTDDYLACTDIISERRDQAYHELGRLFRVLAHQSRGEQPITPTVLKPEVIAGFVGLTQNIFAGGGAPGPATDRSCSTTRR